MRSEATRAAARERQRRKRASDQQFLDDLLFVLEFVGRRHIEDLEHAVQTLAAATDRDVNAVFPIKRVSHVSAKGERPSRRIVSDLAADIRSHEMRGDTP